MTSLRTSLNENLSHSLLPQADVGRLSLINTMQKFTYSIGVSRDARSLKDGTRVLLAGLAIPIITSWLCSRAVPVGEEIGMHVEPGVERPGCAAVPGLVTPPRFPVITGQQRLAAGFLLHCRKDRSKHHLGAIGCSPCTQRPFFQAVCQTGECARTLSDPQ